MIVTEPGILPGTLPGEPEIPLITGSVIELAENINVAGFVSVIDVDGDTVSFSLQGPDAALFQINATNGVLSPVEPLDFEFPKDSDFNNNYEVEIVASDTAGQQARMPLKITATDVNEEPVIIEETFTMIEGFTGTLGQLTAIDPDAGDELAFKIVSVSGSDNPATKLTLESTGLIKASGLVPGNYELIVSVSDAQGLVSLGRVLVVVNPFSDGIPGLNAALPTESGVEPESLAPPATPMNVSVSYEATEAVSETAQTQVAALIVDLGVSFSAPVQMERFADEFQGATQPSAENLVLINTLEETLPSRQESLTSPTRSIVFVNLPPTPQQIDDLIDRIRNSIEKLESEEEAFERKSTLVVTVGGVVMSIGLAGWLISSRVLLAAALSTMSLWRTIDPIPVLLGGSRENDAALDAAEDKDQNTETTGLEHEKSIRRASNG